MKICLICNYDGTDDEGIKKFSLKTCELLIKRNHQVAICNIRKHNINIFRKLRKYDIVHSFLRPTPATLPVISIFSKLLGNGKLVITFLQPPIGNKNIIRKMIKWMQPSLILVQSRATYQDLSSQNTNTKYLWGGVDTQKFSPVSTDTKRRIRHYYGINERSFVALHVGHLRPGRNIEFLLRLKQCFPEMEIIVIGSMFAETDGTILSKLVEAKCIVIQRYMRHIEEIYQLSDAYIFPTINPSSCIELPLSVLEAMSTNLPVLSTAFGALPDVFEGSTDGLFLCEKLDGIIDSLSLVKHIIPRTREAVLNLDWEQVTKKLEDMYYNVLSK